MQLDVAREKTRKFVEFAWLRSNDVAVQCERNEPKACPHEGCSRFMTCVRVQRVRVLAIEDDHHRSASDSCLALVQHHSQQLVERCAKCPGRPY